MGWRYCWFFRNPAFTMTCDPGCIKPVHCGNFFQQHQAPAVTNTLAVWVIWGIMLLSIVGSNIACGNPCKATTIALDVFARCVPGIGTRWLNRLWTQCCRNLWRDMTDNIRQSYCHNPTHGAYRMGHSIFAKRFYCAQSSSFPKGRPPQLEITYCMITFPWA